MLILQKNWSAFRILIKKSDSEKIITEDKEIRQDW